jgi:hypothetical protein
MQLSLQEKLVRIWEEEAYQDEAYAIHHYQNETGINRCVRVLLGGRRGSSRQSRPACCCSAARAC